MPHLWTQEKVCISFNNTLFVRLFIILSFLVLRGPDPNTYLRSDVMPQAVPTTWETIYDPNHPDADWSGLVKSNKYGKKHYQEQSAQKTGILQSESGKSANTL